MPEGHLIHRYAREHASGLTGEALSVSSPQGRFTAAKKLDGRRIERVEAFGKHLFHVWSDGSIVHVHLGQRGVFLHFTPPAPPPFPQVRMRVSSSRLTADLIAPARCERLDTEQASRIVDRLGPDPLRSDADPELALSAIASRDAPIGALLLDQSILAGVGNVLRAEVLFLCRIDPARPGRELSRVELYGIWSTLVDVMRAAALDGRILTVVPHDADRATIPEREARFVYRQESCRRCSAPVRTAHIGGRTSYSCPRCQPR